MRLYGVLDLQGGQVVRAVQGHRQAYRPVASQLCRSSAPGDVAQTLVQSLGIRQAYVADLDAIAGSAHDGAALAAIAAAGMETLLDAGLGDLARTRELIRSQPGGSQLTGIVVALESLVDPGELALMVQEIGPRRAIFSIDMIRSQLLTRQRGLSGLTAVAVADMAWQAGFRRLIVLDLDSVGTGCGPRTLELCGLLLERHGWQELTSGGGVRDVKDVEAFERAGCHGVLVASALHSGTLRPDEVARWAGGS